MTTDVQVDLPLVNFSITRPAYATGADVETKESWRTVVIAPKTITESVTSDGYRVRVHGPVRTKLGKEHSSWRGEADFGAGWQARPLEELPADLAAFTVGPAALIAAAHEAALQAVLS